MRSIHIASLEGNPGGRLGSAVTFALDEPGAVEDLHHTRAVWGASSDIQPITEDRFLLLLLPDDAQEALGLEGRAA